VKYGVPLAALLAPSACSISIPAYHCDGVSHFCASGEMCSGGNCVAVVADSGVGAGLPFGFAPSNFIPSATPTFQPLTIDCPTQILAVGTGHIVEDCGTPPASSLPTFSVEVQDGGENALLVSMSALFIGDAGSLQITGDEPVIFAVYGDAIIQGPIFAGALGMSSGPGASPASVCQTAPGDSSLSGGGGGAGGAFGAGGGGGGRGGTFGGDGGSAGGPNGDSDLIPLRGGCAGGAGGQGSGVAQNSDGGGGGGAIEISASGQLTLGACISVPGGGGQGAYSPSGPSATGGWGGAGGGSGGAILLEANVIDLLDGGCLTANGGGGGAGSIQFWTDVASGEDGHEYDATPASGAAADDAGSVNSIRGWGGAGGSASSPAGAGRAGNSCCGCSGPLPDGGSDPTTYNGGGGGGGGAVGRIRVRAQTGCAIGNALQSPAAVVTCD
jgi:hypothetical protein